jgi:hypothetical protein
VPGKFSLTNKMISNIYAAEKYHDKRPANWRDYYAEEVAAIRLATKVAVRRRHFPRVGTGEFLDITIWVLGHSRHDPDAWLLLAKAAIDGLVDAEVVASDRSGIGTIAGRVLQQHLEECQASLVAERDGVRIGGEGFVMVLAGGERIGHA